MDSVVGGYWCPGYSTKLEEKLGETVKKLQNKNPECWDLYIKNAKDVSFENREKMTGALTNLKYKYPEFVTSYLDIFSN